MYEAEDLSVVEAGGSAVDGVRYFVSYDPGFSAASSQFRNLFREKIGRDPGTFESCAYDGTYLLAKALSKCRLERDCALKELYQTKKFQGASGEVTIAADGASEKEFHLREIRGGTFVSIDSVH